MDDARRKKFIRLIYARAFRYLGASLVLCAIAGGLYRSRMHFVFSLCACAGVFLAWGWFSYLGLTGFRIPGLGKSPKKRPATPYMYRKDKRTWRKPSFAMKAEDFDDDLNDAVSLSSADFTETEIRRMGMWARLACSFLLFLISFIVRY